jgi:hypothetical protein
MSETSDDTSQEEARTNWAGVNKKRAMAQQGSMDRRDKGGLMQYFNLKGTGSAQRADTMSATPTRMNPRPGGMQIPGGTDRPGQGNPLMDPPKAIGRGSRPNPVDQMDDVLKAQEDDELPELSSFFPIR